MITTNRTTLSNGLRIVHHFDGSTPMVAINVMYDVGSRDENPEMTGIAHLFEHLMFSGSVNIPDFDEPVQLAMGENNAWTSTDLTNYYITLPANNIETALWLESDRMLSLEFSQKSLDVQRKVVVEEFNQRYINQPYGDMSLCMMPLAYKVHPYRWQAIGADMKGVETINLDQLREFYYSHYAPNNAVLCICGNISSDQAIRLAEKWFGPIPQRNITTRNLPREPVQTEARYLEMTGKVPQDAITKMFHICDRKHANYYATDLISDLFSRGSSSRLYQSLVKEQEMFTEIDASVSGTHDAGLMYFSGMVHPDKNPQKALEALNNTIYALCSETIASAELEKVLNKVETERIFGLSNYLGKATQLAHAEILGNANDLNNEGEHYRAVTPEHIRCAAQQYLTESNSNTLIYLRKK